MVFLANKGKVLFLLTVLLWSGTWAYPQKLTKEKWVDSVFNELSPDQRIAQLLMIRAYSNRDEAYNQELINLVSELNLGGVCFFQGGPVRQSILTNKLQEKAATPLFVAIDGEWGLGMRLDSVSLFPKQMTLGAIRNNQYIYEMGAEIARQMHCMGIHINFAPDADVNNNPMNPVINARSFGEAPQKVAEKAYYYMKGMQDNGIIAVGKHFPGHGDTGNDSHFTLPVINKTRQQIDSVELYPFHYLINHGIKGIMVSHLQVPALDTIEHSIATLSEPILQDILRKELGFEGMIITDGMDMKGLVDFSDPGMVEAEALKAGNDILLLPVNARNAVMNICCAIESGYITSQMIDEKCRRVLEWKYDAGLADYRPAVISDLIEEVNRQEVKLITTLANEHAITLVANKHNRIPIKEPDTLNMASLVIGDTTLTPFQQMLSNYAPIAHFNLHKEPTKAEMDSISCLLEPYNLIIAGFVRSSDLPQKRFNVTEKAVTYIDSLAQKKSVILNLFASPYALGFFKNSDSYESIMVSYQDNANMQELTAQAVFGGRSIDGQLPVSANDKFKAGCGLEIHDVIRVSFTLPEEDMIASSDLTPIDSIVNDAIAQSVFPGAQVVVIRHGKVIMNKAFGSQTYESRCPLKTDDLFDLASLTKVLATTMTAMKLTDERFINPDKKLSYYVSRLKKTNKKDFTIREFMTHEARLQPFIPFYKHLSTDTAHFSSSAFGRHYSINYPIRIADGLYLRSDYPEKIMDTIIDSKLLPKKGYKYSDLGFILLAKSFEQITQTPFSHYVEINFYRKLGLPTMGYHPRDRFSIARIAPTENDKTFRRQVVHGDVHDQTAAMLGGVAGNAGLFSDALDVGIMMQMVLRNGCYGGVRFFDSTTVAEFTRPQFPERKNRRGLGFDKPSLNHGDPSPACDMVSPASYGHSGFTGTYLWVDPAEDLVYVFLSNRVYPDADNQKITQMNIRTHIHEVIYKAIQKNYKPDIATLGD